MEKVTSTNFRLTAHDLAEKLGTDLTDPAIVLDAIDRTEKWELLANAEAATPIDVFATAPVDKIERELDKIIAANQRRELLHPHTRPDWTTQAVETVFDDYLRQLHPILGEYARSATELAPKVQRYNFEHAARHGYGRELVDVSEAIDRLADYGNLLDNCVEQLERVNHHNLPAWFALVDPGNVPTARLDRVRRKTLNSASDQTTIDTVYAATKITNPADLIRHALHDDAFTLTVPSTTAEVVAGLQRWATAHLIQTSVGELPDAPIQSSTRTA